MYSTNDGMGEKSVRNGLLRGWIGLVAGLAVVWMMAYVVLPWGRTLPYIRLVMEVIADSNVDSGTDWYSQREDTAIAQMYVQNAIRNWQVN